jgi:hypothetical protein
MQHLPIPDPNPIDSSVVSRFLSANAWKYGSGSSIEVHANFSNE